MRLRYLSQGCLVVEVFVTVPLTAGNPPGRGRLGDVELGELVDDVHFPEGWLLREFVAEPDAVVEHAERDDELAPALVAQRDAHFITVVADVAPLAPGLLPGVIETALPDIDQLEVTLELVRIGQDESQARPVDQRPVLASDAVFRTAVAIDAQHHLDRLVG